MDVLNVAYDVFSSVEIKKYQNELVYIHESSPCNLIENDTVDAGCAPNFDSVLCWPRTPLGTLALLPCLEELNGIYYDTSQNASRLCLANGSWEQYTNYNSCRELTSLDVESTVETTTTIYFVGYTISLVALIIAVLIFSRFKDLRCLRNNIHTNLMCTYILSDFTWILAYTFQEPLQAKMSNMYTYLVILLHYFHLTNFFWMFVEGLYLYILVVKTFTGEKIKLRVYALIGWGCPVIFVLLWGIAKSITVTMEDQQTAEFAGNWRPHPFDWIYQGPAIVVLIVNVVFLVVIMWVLITKLRSATSAETQQYRKAAKALLILIPLLGITYIFVIVGPTDGLSKSIYDSIRAILLSTQGLSVALFYCFLNAEVKHTIRHNFNSWHTRRALSSRRQRFSSSKDWSPRSKDSIRLYQGCKVLGMRESMCSEGTTTTLVMVQQTGRASQTCRNPLLPLGDGG